MADKKIVLILNAGQEYIRHTGDDERKYAAQLNRLFEAVTDTYIPLLNAFESLERDGIPFKVGLVLSPVLCNLLEDPVVQKQYSEWIERRLEIGKREIERNASVPARLENAKLCFEKNQEAAISYAKYNQKIIRKFYEFQKKGFVEILATCGTDIFLPQYSDIPEVMSAQVETGLYAYKASFGEVPDGFWLPEMGYYPGIEKILKAYGMNYTVLDSRSFLFSENEPEKGIFYPARFENSLAVFARDSRCDAEIFGEDGFASGKAYLDINKDIGFELPAEELEPFVTKGEPRYSFGYAYCNKEASVTKENTYSYSDAAAHCMADAETFVSRREAVLKEAEKLLPDTDVVSLVVTVSLNKLRSVWNEGIYWIECLFRAAAQKKVQFECARNLLGNQYQLQRIRPYYGSSSGVGYGEDLLSSKNNWMLRYVRKASRRMVDLSERFPADTGLKARLLNLGAKELMLAQSCGWAKMIHNNDFPEYARMRFNRSINDFTAVFDALGSNTVSTEWLTKLENEHQIFPWMNYRIFNRKR